MSLRLNNMALAPWLLLAQRRRRTVNVPLRLCTLDHLADSQLRPCRALRDAGIPPGPRLLIMHHVDSVRRGLRAGQPYAASAKR